MGKSKLTIVLLSIALLASNLWWLYSMIDFGILHTHSMQSCEEKSKALDQMLSIVAVVAERHYVPESVIAAARVSGDESVFEKEGYTWVDGLGLRSMRGAIRPDQAKPISDAMHNASRMAATCSRAALDRGDVVP